MNRLRRRKPARRWPEIAEVMSGESARYRDAEDQVPGDQQCWRSIRGVRLRPRIAAGADCTQRAAGALKSFAEAAAKRIGSFHAHRIDLPRPGVTDDFADSSGASGSRGKVVDAGRIPMSSHGAWAAATSSTIAMCWLVSDGAPDRRNDDKARPVSVRRVLWPRRSSFCVPFPDGSHHDDATPSRRAWRGRGRRKVLAAADDRGRGKSTTDIDIVNLRAANQISADPRLRLLYGGRHRKNPALTIRAEKRVVEPLAFAGQRRIGRLAEIAGAIPATFECCGSAQ